jgi:LPS-assembly protein
VGYRRLDDYGLQLEQVDASFYWPVLRRFALFARGYYDVEENTEVDLFGGVEYNDCCWRVRLVGRRYLTAPASGLIEDARTDTGVFVQVVFKGLAGFGGRIDSLLENGIYGFAPEDT